MQEKSHATFLNNNIIFSLQSKTDSNNYFNFGSTYISLKIADKSFITDFIQKNYGSRQLTFPALQEIQHGRST